MFNIYLNHQTYNTVAGKLCPQTLTYSKISTIPKYQQLITENHLTTATATQDWLIYFNEKADHNTQLMVLVHVSINFIFIS